MSQEPLILNIESATEVCSVCLSKGKELLNLNTAALPNDHSKIITLLIRECLESTQVALSDLHAVAISSGPGSYTSLRVGTSTAKGICYAQKIPLIAVDTLHALAFATYLKEKNENALYCPMIDARRMEVYCRLFNAGGDPVTEASAMIIERNSFEEYFSKNQEIVFSGNGMEKCRQVLNSQGAIFTPQTCSAVNLIEFSVKAFASKNFVDLAYFTPNYLKAPNITTSKKELFK